MIKFTKMQGLGNDYVYIDAINQKIENESSLAQMEVKLKCVEMEFVV